MIRARIEILFIGRVLPLALLCLVTLMNTIGVIEGVTLYSPDPSYVLYESLQ